jgi:fructokinase
VVGVLQEALQVPVGFDTDVNGAALAEYVWGNWPNPDPLLYFTIGTGVGMGAIINGKALHGLVHPESGHIRIPHDLAADPFPGACPYHGDCFEGLASGPAMRKRWNQPAEELPAGHPAWDLESTYIALALVNVICAFSPRQIVLGGGVMSQEEMFPSVRQKVLRLLNEYVQSPVILKSIESYIVPPALGNRSGVLGAIALAQQMVEK